jgi:hypothetical protein
MKSAVFLFMCVSLSKLIESSHTPRRVFSIFFCEKQERPIKIAHQRYLEIMLGLRGVWQLLCDGLFRLGLVWGVLGKSESWLVGVGCGIILRVKEKLNYW